MKKILFFSFLLALTGCGDGDLYWDISKFRMVPDALEDGEEIKLIYCSQGPDYNSELKYYYHVVVVSQKTGDTVNVLTTINNGFEKGDGDKIFNFFSAGNIATKIIEMAPDQIQNAKHVDSFNNVELRKIDKVARDPKFDHIADNDFPTVIGSIGVITKIEPEE